MNGDGFAERPSGLIVPQSAEAAQQRSAAEQGFRADVAAIVAWARRWPKEGEPALNTGDIADVALAKARVNLWERSYTELVTRAAIQALELDRPAVPAKGKGRRGKLAAVPAHQHTFQPINATFEQCTGCPTMKRRALDPQDSGQPVPPRTLAPQTSAEEKDY